MAESNASSSKSKRSAASDKLEKGPTMIDGHLFLTIKRCPLCLTKNSDENIIKAGPFGPDFSAHQVWAKGSSTKPQGMLNKVCQLAFVHGGFAAQFGNSYDQFLDARRRDPQLNKEWQATLDAGVDILEKSTVTRLGKNVLADMDTALQGARKTVVEAFKTSQKRVIAPYRCILKENYEKQFPGRIQSLGLPVKMLDTEQGRVEVVMVRKLPDGEWDCNFEDLVGVTEREDVDPGAHQIRARQGEYKYADLASRTRLSKEDIVAASAIGIESAIAIGKAPVSGGQESADESEAPDSAHSSEPDVMDWAVNCLIEDGCSAAKRPKAASSKPAPASSSSKARVPWARAAGSAASSTPILRMPAVGRSAFSGSSRSHTAEPLAPPKTPDDKERKKFAGKSPEEVLEPLGWARIMKEFGAMMASVGSAEMATFLRGSEVETFNTMNATFKKDIGTVHKSLVALDIKVRKWQSPPEVRNTDSCLTQ